MSIYKICSVLLEYPEQELLEALSEIRVLIDEETRLKEQEHFALEQFFKYLHSHDLTDLQVQYVKTFDLTPEHSLHLTHHLFGDERGRGPALIDLAEYYKEYGLQVDERELPDYLPMILEFCAQLDVGEAGLFLGQTVKVLEQLAKNLEKADSPYAPLVRVVENLGRLTRIAA